MTGLCMVCHRRPTFVTMRCESTPGVAATYWSCHHHDCLLEVSDRILGDHVRLAAKVGLTTSVDRSGVIDVDIDDRPLLEP